MENIGRRYLDFGTCPNCHDEGPVTFICHRCQNPNSRYVAPVERAPHLGPVDDNVDRTPAQGSVSPQQQPLQHDAELWTEVIQLRQLVLQQSKDIESLRADLLHQQQMAQHTDRVIHQMLQSQLHMENAIHQLTDVNCCSD